MSLIDIDTWITEYEACERFSRDIQSQIVLRDRESRLSDEYSKLSGTVRVRLRQFASDLNQLGKKLDISSNYGKLTVEEAERRQRQLESLQSKLIHLEKQFKNAGSTLTNERTDLLQASGTSHLWEDEDEDVPMLSQNDRNYTVDDLRKQQIQILDNQNDGLDALSKVISRQKDLAIQIGSEVDVQNDLIDTLADSLERTDTRVNTETRHIAIVDRKDSTWGYWIVIIILFIAIIIVVLV